MNTLGEVSKVLAERATKRRYGKMQLAADAGVTYRTLNHVLSGEQDFKVSTLMAVADRLGLELMLVPKEARVMFPAGQEQTITARDNLRTNLRGFKGAKLQGFKAPLAFSEEEHPSGIVSKVRARLAHARKRGL